MRRHDFFSIFTAVIYRGETHIESKIEPAQYGLYEQNKYNEIRGITLIS